MRVLITGTSSGIGKETANYFLQCGHEVIGLDLLPATIEHENYHHYVTDIWKGELPVIKDVEILINNAGVQNSYDDIDINLKGTMRVTEAYAFQKKIRSVLFNASSSAHTGFEFAAYSASKGGILAYMKHVAWRLAAEYHATCNSISFGGVKTELNKEVMDDPQLFDQIMKVTPLKKWMEVDEAAEWIYFMTVRNHSCSGQDILIDNGEKDLNCTFVWPDF